MRTEVKGRGEMRATIAAGTVQDSFCECRLCTEAQEWEAKGRCVKVETWD